MPIKTQSAGRLEMSRSSVSLYRPIPQSTTDLAINRLDLDKILRVAPETVLFPNVIRTQDKPAKGYKEKNDVFSLGVAFALSEEFSKSATLLEDYYFTYGEHRGFTTPVDISISSKAIDRMGFEPSIVNIKSVEGVTDSYIVTIAPKDASMPRIVMHSHSSLSACMDAAYFLGLPKKTITEMKKAKISAIIDMPTGKEQLVSLDLADTTVYRANLVQDSNTIVVDRVPRFLDYSLLEDRRADKKKDALKPEVGAYRETVRKERAKILQRAYYVSLVQNSHHLDKAAPVMRLPDSNAGFFKDRHPDADFSKLQSQLNPEQRPEENQSEALVNKALLRAVSASGRLKDTEEALRIVQSVSPLASADEGQTDSDGLEHVRAIIAKVRREVNGD